MARTAKITDDKQQLSSTPPSTQSKKSSQANTSAKSKKPAQKVQNLEERTKQVVRKVHDQMNTLENAMDVAASKVVAKISPSVKKKIANVSKKADLLEEEIDEIADKVNKTGSDMVGDGKGSTVQIDFQFSSKVSRLFIFRFLWAIIQLPILYFWTIWIIIVSIVHFLYMLLLGKRSKSLWEDQTRYGRHLIKWNCYMKGLIDKRPKIIED